MDQHLVQILTDIELSALYLRTLPERLFYTLNQQFFLNPELFHQLQNQAPILCQQGIKQMLLLDLLISVIVCDLLASLYRKHRILCEFVNIHTFLPPYE